MGNEVCCQQTTAQQRKQEVVLSHLSQSVVEIKQQQKPIIIEHLQDLEKAKSSLSQNVIDVINKFTPFEKQFQAQDQKKIKVYGKDVYQGPVDLIDRPTKIGKMYKENGAYFIGHFESGKAQGACFYVMKDGSYFTGVMKDNFAHCESGRFVTKDLQYKGGFQANLFHGKGIEKSLANLYVFQGMYIQGKRKSGKLIWRSQDNQFIYEGQFNSHGNFEGQGKLTDSQGVYEGQFLDGEKHGYGIYRYNTQLRYQGFYVHNKKQGEGKLFNNDNSIAYKGVFKNGMPNGKGIATTKSGVQFQTVWIDGIDSRLL